MGNKKILKHFEKADRTIHKAMDGLDFSVWFSEDRKNDYFFSLTRSIVGQQLSGKAAGTIYGRFQELFPAKKVDPQKLLEIKDQKLRDAGLSWGKVSYVKDLAEKVLDGTLELDRLEKMEDQEVINHLIMVKGIGPWTGEMFLMFTLRREDVFSFGDLGLKRGIENLYNLKDPTIDQIEKIIAPWSPYKTYGSIALWHSLDNL
jgi:DNA-3-methyladenine glycosylase II